MENLFQVLHECGKAHGLENDDFEKYRRFCTRKMQALRAKHKLIKDAPASKELLEVLVFKCEWVWAQGSLLRSQLHANPRKRFHLRRVAKSCFKVATKLKSVALKVVDGKNLNPFLAYANFLTATASLDLEQIESAYKQASKAKQMLLKLNDPFSAKKLEDVQTLLRFIEYKSMGFGIDLSAHQFEAEVEAISSTLESTQLKSSQPKPAQKIVKVADSQVSLSPSCSCIKSPQKALQLSLKELSACPDSENAKLQCLFFEIERFKKEFKTSLTAFLKSYRQHDKHKKLAPVKLALLRVKHAHLKPQVQNEIQNALSLLNAFSSVYRGHLEDAEFVCDNFSQSSQHVVPNLNRLVDALDCLIRSRSRPDQKESKPATSNSFFSMARNLLSPASKSDEPKKGLMGMFSSFFSKPQ